MGYIRLFLITKIKRCVLHAKDTALGQIIGWKIYASLSPIINAPITLNTINSRNATSKVNRNARGKSKLELSMTHINIKDRMTDK